MVGERAVSKIGPGQRGIFPEIEKEETRRGKRIWRDRAEEKAARFGTGGQRTEREPSVCVG